MASGSYTGMMDGAESLTQQARCRRLLGRSRTAEGRTSFHAKLCDVRTMATNLCLYEIVPVLAVFEQLAALRLSSRQRCCKRPSASKDETISVISCSRHVAAWLGSSATGTTSASQIGQPSSWEPVMQLNRRSPRSLLRPRSQLATQQRSSRARILQCVRDSANPVRTLARMQKLKNWHSLLYNFAFGAERQRQQDSTSLRCRKSYPRRTFEDCFVTFRLTTRWSFAQHYGWSARTFEGALQATEGAIGCR